MPLVKLLPKSFLALGTNYGIDYRIFPHLYFWATKVETHAWNSAFPSVLSQTQEVESDRVFPGQLVETSETIILWLHIWIRFYQGRLGFMGPEAEGKASTRGSIGCPKPEDKVKSKPLGEIWGLMNRMTSCTPKSRVRGKIQTKPRIWCCISFQPTCPCLSELANPFLMFPFMSPHILWIQFMMLAFLLEPWLFTQCLDLFLGLPKSAETTQPLGVCYPKVKPMDSTPTPFTLVPLVGVDQD